MKDGWLQGGDIVSGSGDTGDSIYGSHFPDEGFSVSHTMLGVLGCPNVGPHTNNSQFYVTTASAPFLDSQFVAFGRLIDGLRVLRTVEKVQTRNERPVQPVMIKDCGNFEP